MKTVSKLALVAFAAISFAACGGTKKSTSTTDTTKVVTDTTHKTVVDTAKPKPVDTTKKDTTHH